MEPITLTALAVFLSPYLVKAGEKVAEKTVETLFDSRGDLADKFLGLFRPEFQTLGLREGASQDEIRKSLEEKPDIQDGIRQKIDASRDLMNQLTEALSRQEGRTITCKTYIENATNFVINQ